jgi:hypothetical protein
MGIQISFMTRQIVQNCSSIQHRRTYVRNTTERRLHAGAKMRRIWGALLPRRGYRILAQGFNPGNRPLGRRALKGRQIRRIKTAKNIFILSRQSLNVVLVRFLLANGRLHLCPTNTLSFSVAFEAHLAEVISRPSGRTALIECFPGLKP